MKTEGQLKAEIARLTTKVSDLKESNRQLSAHVKRQGESIHFKNQELVRLINYLNSREAIIDSLALSE